MFRVKYGLSHILLPVDSSFPIPFVEESRVFFHQCMYLASLSIIICLSCADLILFVFFLHYFIPSVFVTASSWFLTGNMNSVLTFDS